MFENVVMNYNKRWKCILASVLTAFLMTSGSIAAESLTENVETDAAQELVTVTNVDEFLAAIAPDTTILLKAGEYDLSTAADYCMESENPYYTWEEVWGEEGQTHAELVIEGAKNLTIEGEGMDKTLVEAVPRYANVFRFRDCENLSIKDLTAGHTQEPGECSGGVVLLEGCSNSTVVGCGLYGCGTIGVDAYDSSNLLVADCDIYECSYEAVHLFSCQDSRIEQCRIYKHGTRADQESAVAVFNIDYSDDVVIQSNEVYENAAGCLLSLYYTKNAVFLSNTVRDNRFDDSMFFFDQYAAVVDGCSFADNGTISCWVDGSGVPAKNAEGERLKDADFEAMTLSEIDPDTIVDNSTVKPVEVEPGGSVEVATADEFLRAIGPDRTIILNTKLLDLSEASDYGSAGGDYYFWEDCYDGPQLVIQGVNDLTITMKEGAPEETTISAVPRYANVLAFRGCKNLQLTGFTAGHTKEQGSCSGGVLDFWDCLDVTIDNMRLYGCGVLGVQTSGCSGIAVLQTEIFECSFGAVECYQTDTIRFEECDIHDVPSPMVTFYGCSGAIWNGEEILDQDGAYDVDQEGTLQVYGDVQE